MQGTFDDLLNPSQSNAVTLFDSKRMLCRFDVNKGSFAKWLRSEFCLER